MPDSRAQVRLAHAVLEGEARETDMSKAVAREIVSKVRTLKSLPERVKPPRARRIS